MSNPLLSKEGLDALWDKYEEEDPLQEGNEWGERCIKAEAKHLVEWIEEQAKYNLSSISQLDFYNSPMWKELRKEVGL